MKHLRYFYIIHLHPILFIILSLAFVTGMIMEFLVIFGIVLFHEYGHYFWAKHFGWKIEGIYLWIFGGVMHTEADWKRPMKEEVIVTIAGPLQHLWIYLALYFVTPLDILPEATIQLIHYYNILILFGNLLPIWPLDGGKLLYLFFSFFLSFLNASRYIITFSVTFILMFTVYLLLRVNLPLTGFFLLAFLIWENRIEWNRQSHLFLQFLWQRFVHTHKPDRYCQIYSNLDASLISILKKFKRYHYHQIYLNDNNRMITILEDKCLAAFFNKEEQLLKIKQLI
ncbi:site-2 protease family protein [Saliterribacillus persicus]|uniref:Sporulation factor SpoIVFB n=1 Tax=Saliterribacillus persicus TaxID=930114 RepID=A0A368XEN1_9BACI|nr:site-2 protease family protein [Saliterribacillus persicus]RCW66410.1 sporulation factor SpoIVFB [Saliterribacillus persicus]